MRVYNTSAKREVPYIYGQGTGPWKLKGVRCSFMLSEPYFEAFSYKSARIQNRMCHVKKSDPNLEGARAVAPPPGSATEFYDVVLVQHGKPLISNTYSFIHIIMLVIFYNEMCIVISICVV